MQVLSALDLKIRSFLQQVGFDPTDPEASSSIQLVRFFEQEHGCSVLAMLEQEYWEEQIDLEVNFGLFGKVREHLDASSQEAFDNVWEAILATTPAEPVSE